MLLYSHREVKPSESAFPKTPNPEALSSQELIFYSMLPNKIKLSTMASETSCWEILAFTGAKV